MGKSRKKEVERAIEIIKNETERWVECGRVSKRVEERDREWKRTELVQLSTQ